MPVTTDEMAAFARDFARTRRALGPDVDLFWKAGIDGDDAVEFMGEYSKKFNVNMDKYLWYFHHDEESLGSFGAVFFAPPSYRVKRIPITIMMLTNFANAGRWDIKYPKHTLPKRRYDILINQASLVLFLFVIAAVIIDALI